MSHVDLTAPGTRFSVRERARAGERFARQAFAGQVDRIMPLRIAGQRVAFCRLVSAVVDADGKAAELTFEVLPEER